MKSIHGLGYKLYDLPPPYNAEAMKFLEASAGILDKSASNFCAELELLELHDGWVMFFAE